MKCENCSYCWYEELDGGNVCHADPAWPAPCEEETESAEETIEEENFDTMTWDGVAEQIQTEIEIDWKDQSFICPICEEPILKEDWYYIGAECDEKGSPHPFCPICGSFFED